MTEFRTITNAKHEITEAQKIEIYSLGKELLAHLGADEYDNTILRLALPREAEIRAKLSSGEIIDLFDEYHEAVRLGSREPLTSG